MSTSCYLGPGFSHLRNSVYLMVVTWMSTEFCDLKVVHLFKCIFNLGSRAVNMLRVPRYLNPVLPTATVIRKYSAFKDDQ